MQCTILFGIGTLKGGSFECGRKMLRERFYDGYMFALVYWPWAYIGLYTIVPARYGNLYMDFWALGWYTLVSFVANKDKDVPVPSWGRIYRAAREKLQQKSR